MSCLYLHNIKHLLKIFYHQNFNNICILYEKMRFRMFNFIKFQTRLNTNCCWERKLSYVALIVKLFFFSSSPYYEIVHYLCCLRNFIYKVLTNWTFSGNIYKLIKTNALSIGIERFFCYSALKCLMLEKVWFHWYCKKHIWYTCISFIDISFVLENVKRKKKN